MRAKQFTYEANLGTTPKRPARAGSRPDRGHKAEPRYKEQGAAEGAEFGAYYSEQVAQQIFDKRQDITSEDEVLNQAYHIVSDEQGQKRARYMFNYDEDFPSDVVSNYFWLQKQSAHSEVDESADEHDYERRRKGKTPAELGGSDAWYHRGDNPHYYGFERGSHEYKEYMQAYNEWDEGPRGGKQWDENVSEAPIVHKHDVVPTDLKPGDEVACDAGMGKTMFGVVKRIGRTMIHVQFRNGEVFAFAPKHVELMTPTYWQDKIDAETARRAKWKKKEKTISESIDAIEAELLEHKKGVLAKKYTKKPIDQLAKKKKAAEKAKEKLEPIKPMESVIDEHGKASRELCKSSKPDQDLGASMLASCKSQGLRARDGNKSHKLGKSPKSRVKVGGHRIKGQKYGGPLPDWS